MIILSDLESSEFLLYTLIEILFKNYLTLKIYRIKLIISQINTCITHQTKKNKRTRSVLHDQ